MTRAQACFVTYAAALICALSLLHATSSRLAVDVTPRAGIAPLDLRIRVTVEPNSDNRWLRVEAASQEFSRASEFQLDGEASPRTRWITWRGFPPGDYVVAATLTTSLGVTSTATAAVSVIGN